MPMQTTKQQRSTLSTGSVLVGLAMSMLLSVMWVNTTLAAMESPAATPPEGSIPIWIQDPYTSDSVLTFFSEPDQSLWNAKRIADYEESLKVNSTPPLGIFTIDLFDTKFRNGPL